MIAYQRGRELAERYRLEPRADLRPVLRDHAIDIIPWRFHGRVREVIVEGTIGIDDRHGEAWTRWLTAHALGHHLLHTGASLYLESWQWVNKVKAERQAEEFAAGLLAAPLLAPGPSSGTALLRPITTKGLARRLGIPESKAEWAIALATGAA